MERDGGRVWVAVCVREYRSWVGKRIERSEVR